MFSLFSRSLNQPSSTPSPPTYTTLWAPFSLARLWSFFSSASSQFSIFSNLLFISIKTSPFIFDPPEFPIDLIYYSSFCSFFIISQSWFISSLIGPSSTLSAFWFIKSSKWARWSLSLDRSIFFRSFIIFSTFFSVSGYEPRISHNKETSFDVNWGLKEERSSLSPECLFKRFLMKLISESKWSLLTFFFFRFSISSEWSFNFSFAFLSFFLCLSVVLSRSLTSFSNFSTRSYKSLNSSFVV